MRGSSVRVVGDRQAPQGGLTDGLRMATPETGKANLQAGKQELSGLARGSLQSGAAGTITGVRTSGLHGAL